MKKLLAILLVLSMIAGMLAACQQDTPQVSTTTQSTTTTTTTQPTCNVHVDDNEDYLCDNCGAELEKPENPPVDGDCTEHKDANTDYVCDDCGAAIEKPDDPFEKPEQNEKPEITGSIEVTLTGYSFETIYCEWKPIDGADSYNIYCDGVKVDTELIRNYGTYYRCDVLGLKAGEYTIDILPVQDGAEVTAAKTSFKRSTINHLREGFAFVNGTSSGAYNDDGTLKSNARVLYVTNTNKDTITMNVQISKNGPEPIVGLQNILTALKKGYETKPVCIRFIGNITDPATLDKGDLLIDCGEGKFTGGITLEGVGNDATFNGFGVRIKGATNIEIRNIGFMNCDSNEGDSISLQQDNDHIWIHNCDLFYGAAGGDADQNKGDGALDTKKSTYVTHSFNHFYDTGKSNLQGMTSETTENYITYHHNWYDHSDSRHPRVRTCTVHIYNNFYDGISKYAVGSTMGSSLFVENNYFLNTKYPMLISEQGSDIAGTNEGTFSGENGGIIKAFGNVIIGGNGVVSYQQNNTQFDCYLASSRDEKVPSSVVTYKGGTTYNNFDTSASMYEYNVQTAEQAMETVKEFAGRVQGGDFKWTFTDADNSSYAVDNALKSALVNYKGTLVSTNVSGGAGNNDSGNGGENGGDNGGDNGNENGGTDTPVVTPTPEGAIPHNFHESGKTSSFFTINGNLSTSKGTITYNGMELTQCLKMESSTSITFTLTEARTLTLVFGTAGKTVKVDGTKYTTDSNCIVTVELEAGSHTITKGDSINLYYMILE
ncbi:MAG: pectate lyase [Clostridia bacterium]|nr:pectate lyase [Clostridia bacterium]